MSDVSPYAVGPVEDFSGGLRSGPEPNRIPLGSSPEAQNAWFTDVSLVDPRRVTMGRRPGTRLLNPTTLSASKTVDGLFDYRRFSTNPVLLAVCNGQLSTWDGVDTFTAVGAAVWTAGRPARGTFFRENLFIVDGTAGRRYNGTALFAIGQIAPTAAPALAAVAGPGVTGTYEGFGVWYDPVLDHESSPSDTVTAVVFANQQRQWTKPAGAPAAEYTYWRVYARRTDTNELGFYRVATTAVGTATVTESLSDDLRRRNLGPGPNDNDAPPTTLAILQKWKGFGIGVELNSDEFVISKIGDLQSWHPRNRFTPERGSGTPITGVKPYGEELLIQKDHQTWRLVGDTIPFAIRNVHSRYGGVSQDSGVEVDGHFYDWDRVVGPYVTDLSTWTQLATGRIKALMQRLTRTPDALAKVRCVFAEEHSLVIWSIPVDGNERVRVLVPYHTDLKTFLPPMVGLEWAAMCGFTNTSTSLQGVVIGDAWGRVFELFTGDCEGVPTTVPMTTISGTLTGGSATTFTDSTATLYTTGSGLVGLPVCVISPAGTVYWRRVASNTGTVVTIDTINDNPFSPAPAAGWTYEIGGIDWYWWTPVIDIDDSFIEKALQHLYVEAKATTSDTTLTVRMRKNQSAAVDETLTFTFQQQSGLIWGTGVWGDLWGAATRRPSKKEIRKAMFAVQFGFSSHLPNERIAITCWALTADKQPARRAPAT